MKKAVAVLLLLVFIFPTVISAEELYSYTNEKVLTDGVQLKTIQRFYADYSLNINCITANLKNENLSLELLKSAKGIDKTDTVLNLAKGKDGVVAAANADFFSAYKGDQNFSLGIEVKDGVLLQSHINQNMAAGLFDGKSLDLSYIETKAEIKAQNGNILPVTHINKPTDYYGALLLYTSDFNGAVSPFLPEGITAVTVTDGIVTGKGVSMGGVIPIPENGYILAIDDNMTPMLDMNMNVGEKAELSVSATPSIENVKTAFGGGTLFLKDGKKTEITHNVSGNHPRSVIGTNGDGTVVYIITVDGRQTLSRGVSLTSLQDICLELGLVNAINLDGGGSTALVGKTHENPAVHTLNSPSENRRVINAVGVVSSAKPGAAVSFEVKAQAEYVLEGDSADISVIPLDKNQNVASNVAGSLAWKTIKGDGKVENNVFYAKSGGETVVELYHKNKRQASVTFNVIGADEVCGIDAQAVYSVKKGDTLSISGAFKVFDKDGNTAVINNPKLLNIKYDTSFLSISESKIKVLKDGAGIVELSCGKARRSIRLVSDGFSIDSAESIVADPFLSGESGGFSFNILANAPEQTFFTRLVYARAMDTFRTGDASAVLGKQISVLTPTGMQPISAGAFKEYMVKNGRVITLNYTPSCSLRIDGQWGKLTEAVKNAKEKNIFILLNENFYIKDSLENRVFHDFMSDMAKNKNIFVVYNGVENNVRIHGTVRYISISDVGEYTGIKPSMEKMKYLSFNITDKGVTYSFKKLYGSVSENSGTNSGIIIE